MSLAQQARAVERDIFGALLGALAGVVICRLLLLATEINAFVLAALMFIGAWTGAFIAHVATNRTSAAIDSVRSLAFGFRSICLRAILWMLGAAAVLGVLSVLTGSFEVVGRVAGTAAITGIAAALLVPLLPYLDDEKKWRIGLLGTASVFAAYFLGMPSIWEIGYRPIESALAGVVVALMMPVGLIAMQLTHTANTRVAGWSTAALYAAALTLFLFAVWGDWKNDERLFQTGFILLGFGSLGIASLVNAFTGDGRHWRWIGVAFAVIVAAVSIQCVWTRSYLDSAWIVTLASIPAVVAHANLSMLAPLQGGQVWWRIGTIAAAAVTAAALDTEMWINDAGRLTFVGRVALAAGIVTSTGTLAMAIFTRLNQSASGAPRPRDGAPAQIALTCPQCGKSQTIPLDEPFRCDCGVQIRVQIEAPSP
jgi:hypothetical protein